MKAQAQTQLKYKPYVMLPRSSSPGSWSLPDLCRAYNLPRNLTGGNTIAIVELGGALSLRDVQQFSRLFNMPMPNIFNPNSPFLSDPAGADFEIALDVQVASYVSWYCTGKIPTIVMIWDQTGEIYPGITEAAMSRCDTCSISWGAPEDEWLESDRAALESAAWSATSTGMAILAASGDNDFGDGEAGAHVDLPAACPAIISCSGTTKTVPTISSPSSESCWNNGNGEGTGGGFTKLWRRPKWQSNTPRGTPAHWSRAVGDVSANADPDTGYQIIVGGNNYVVGGTSAVAPFWSALLAAVKAQPSFCTWKLYEKRAECFLPVIDGNNGKYPASICNGLGVPNGATISSLLD